jgi:hypothetical protein
VATYTAKLFTTLDGFGAGRVGYWGKDGPELREHQARTFFAAEDQALGRHLPDAGGAAGDGELTLIRDDALVFPVITGATGENPILAGLPDIDLELVDSRLFDGQVQQLVYTPQP